MSPPRLGGGAASSAKDTTVGLWVPGFSSSVIGQGSWVLSSRDAFASFGLVAGWIAERYPAGTGRVSSYPAGSASAWAPGVSLEVGLTFARVSWPIRFDLLWGGGGQGFLGTVLLTVGPRFHLGD